MRQDLRIAGSCEVTSAQFAVDALWTLAKRTTAAVMRAMPCSRPSAPRWAAGPSQRPNRSRGSATRSRGGLDRPTGVGARWIGRPRLLGHRISRPGPSWASPPGAGSQGSTQAGGRIKIESARKTSGRGGPMTGHDGTRGSPACGLWPLRVSGPRLAKAEVPTQTKARGHLPNPTQSSTGLDTAARIFQPPPTLGRPKLPAAAQPPNPRPRNARRATHLRDSSHSQAACRAWCAHWSPPSSGSIDGADLPEDICEQICSTTRALC